jgi:hypothetical protein
VVQSCYGSIYVSGLHGSTVVGKTAPLEIRGSNFGESVEQARLAVSVKDEEDRMVDEVSFADLRIEGNGAVTVLGELAVKDLLPGLYSIEHVLHDENQAEIARSLEMFFLAGE